MEGSAGVDRTLPQLIVEIKLENINSNKSLCEELFGGELEVTEDRTDPGKDGLFLPLKGEHVPPH